MAIILAVVLSSGSDDDGTPNETPPPTAPTATASRPEAPASKEQEEPEGPIGDVKVTRCAVDSATKWASAELTITNRSSKTSNYAISVEFVDSSGKRLDESIAAANNLAPGQKAEVTAQGLKQLSEKITCRVTDVTRYAS